MKKKQICFCMTSGVSLETWSQKGLLSRELSTLNNIASSVIILSYGEKKIEKNIISSNDNLSVISLPRPPRFISPRIYTPLAVLFNSKLLDPCRDVDLVMSNQMEALLSLL